MRHNARAGLVVTFSASKPDAPFSATSQRWDKVSDKPLHVPKPHSAREIAARIKPRVRHATTG